MGQNALSRSNYTLSEYFEIDNSSDTKYEFERGAILAMSGGSFNHSRIGGNIFRFLANKLESVGSPCESFNSDARVYVKDADSSLHPDVSVFCNEIEYVDEENQAAINPILIFEVLSKSTAAYDRGEKFIKYRFLDSLKEYVLVDQYSARVELFRKMPEGDWLMKTFDKDKPKVLLESIGIELDFDEIYQKVQWDTED